jgi:hypothetical protein
MGRHSVHRYRPLHSVHGPLYWVVLMWPVLLTRAVRQRTGVGQSPEEVAAFRLGSSAPAGTPRRAAAAVETWQLGEGGVAPQWEDHPASALR